MTKPETEVPADMAWVLWAGTIGLESPIAARVEGARAAGFGRISVSGPDVVRAAEEGTKPHELGRYLRDAGLEVVIDPVMNWYGSPLVGFPFADVSVDEVLGMAEALDAVSLGAIGHPLNEIPIEEVAGPFGVLCDRAREVGALVHLEFMPMLSITDLASAWTIVSGADRPNGGIMFDTWHFFHTGADFGLLEQVPGDRIFGVQVSDADPQPGADLGQDTFNRLLPGDGSLDLVRVLGVLDRIGGLHSVGPEVISPMTAAMAPAEAARVTRERIADLIAQARA